MKTILSVLLLSIAALSSAFWTVIAKANEVDAGQILLWSTCVALLADRIKQWLFDSRKIIKRLDDLTRVVDDQDKVIKELNNRIPPMGRTQE